MAEGQCRRPCRGRPVPPVTGGVRVFVCGSSASIPRPGRACSSYLIEGEGTAVVADLGSGAFANVLRRRSAESLDAVVISHMHADHFLDVVPLRYALKYGPRSNARKIPLYLPPGGEAILERLVAALDADAGRRFLSDVYEVATYDPSLDLKVGAATLRFAPTRHFVPTFAIRATIGPAVVAYSSDTAPVESVVELARGAQVFFCEATLGCEADGETADGHSSALQAGDMAARSGAKQLVLTHYVAGSDADAMKHVAATAYNGAIHVADDGDVIRVGTPR